jgi:putative transposase
MMYPLVRDLTKTGTRVRVPVAVACRVLKFSTQGFYAWLKTPVTQRDWSDAHLINAALDVQESDPAYGYRFISDELPAVGIIAPERRVWWLCSQQRIWSTFSKKRGVYRKAGPAVHDDLVKRNFTAAKLNELWLTDITEHWTGQGKLYLCAIKDVRSNKIVGYSIDDRMKASLAVTALSYAMKARGHLGTVVHSDRGSQFRSRKFVRALADNGLLGLLGSMGRVGACADNAAMESFFALLQKNVLNRQTWATRQELRLAIVHWIEGSYHRKRRQRRLGRLTPIEFEIMESTTALAA